MKADRVAIYCRVSTDGQSVDLQVNELREYAARRDWQIVEEYIDYGVSGVKESRPALNRLMADAKQRRFDIVACWKLDRFGRSVKHVVVALADFEALGISFISLKDNLDLSTPSGRLMFQIIAAMAEFERALIQERVRSGLQNAKRRGRRLGRPPVAVDRARIARLRSNGASIRTIAAQLGVSRATVHKVIRQCLQNPLRQ
jgi:DNA invertase Pin-like site-specific DNA recombinase